MSDRRVRPYPGLIVANRGYEDSGNSYRYTVLTVTRTHLTILRVDERYHTFGPWLEPIDEHWRRDMVALKSRRLLRFDA